MPTFPLYLVDAFVVGAAPCTGNGAGVVLLPAGGGGLADADRQAVAAELNQVCEGGRERAGGGEKKSWIKKPDTDAPLPQSETAFVQPLPSDDAATLPPSRFLLRWFTPTTEVPLCGHATLAAAAALVDAGAAPPPPCALTFETVHSGALGVRVSAGEGGGAPPTFELDLPARPPTDPLPPAAAAVAAALTAGSAAAVASLAFNAELGYLVAVLSADDAGGPGAAAAALASLAPSPAALLAASPGRAVSGVIATARDGDGVILSRFFGPWLGIDEDPVTGSAHAVLAPLWLGRGSDGGGGATTATATATATPARQLSARGGELTVALGGGGARVAVGGRARVVVRGEIDV